MNTRNNGKRQVTTSPLKAVKSLKKPAQEFKSESVSSVVEDKLTEEPLRHTIGQSLLKTSPNIKPEPTILKTTGQSTNVPTSTSSTSKSENMVATVDDHKFNGVENVLVGDSSVEALDNENLISLDNGSLILLDNESLISLDNKNSRTKDNKCIISSDNLNNGQNPLDSKDNNQDYEIKHGTDLSAKPQDNNNNDDLVQCISITKEDVCSDVDKGMKRKQNKNGKLKTQHKNKLKDKQTFPCKLCSKLFKSQYLLKIHQIAHTTGKPFKCDVCQKTFKREFSLNNHMNIHNDSMFKCEFCDKTFSYKLSLSEHYLAHTNEKRYKCDECERMFKYSTGLYRHRRQHQGVRYKCEVCNKLFLDQASVYKHRMIHSGEKPFSCDICGKAFARKCNMLTHKKIHSYRAPKPIVHCCTLCDKKYPYATSLRRHLATVHDLKFTNTRDVYDTANNGLSTQTGGDDVTQVTENVNYGADGPITTDVIIYKNMEDTCTIIIENSEVVEMTPENLTDDDEFQLVMDQQTE